MVLNCEIYLCFLMCFVVANATYGKDFHDHDDNEREITKAEKQPLHHEITDKYTGHTHEIRKMISDDGSTISKIVGEVVEQNIQNADPGNPETTLESEHLIKVTAATPRKVKKVRNIKKSKQQKLGKMMNIKKRKSSIKKTTKKRKYPKKYNAKKHGLKKMKDKKRKKTKSKHEKRNKKVSKNSHDSV